MKFHPQGDVHLKAERKNVWVPSMEFEGYSVSDRGEVRNDRTKRIMKPHMNQAGVVAISVKTETRLLHRGLAKLVADHFLEPPPFPSRTNPTPIHLDGDRWNCAASNLMWRPRWHAIQYHQQFSEPYLNHIERPVRARDEKEVYPDTLTAAMAHGLLEREVVYSILAGTPCWPTYQYFELVE